VAAGLSVGQQWTIHPFARAMEPGVALRCMHTLGSNQPAAVLFCIADAIK
jgi:hypothetical protein